MNKLTKIEQDFWQSYLDTLPKEEVPENPFIIASHAGNEEITDELIALYLQGKKTAGSGLLKGYEVDNIPAPKLGDYWIILDRNNKPRCIVKTIEVVYNKFKDVPEEIARAEGEGGLSLEHWRDGHGKFFSEFLEQYGIEDLEEAVIVTEYFDAVYPKLF